MKTLTISVKKDIKKLENQIIEHVKLVDMSDWPEQGRLLLLDWRSFYKIKKSDKVIRQQSDIFNPEEYHLFGMIVVSLRLDHPFISIYSRPRNLAL